MTPDHVISVMQALKRGKTIQRKGWSTGNKWVDCDMESLLRGVKYRVKPETKARAAK